MIVERILFNILAFGLFFMMFIKMVNRNDSNYVYILIVQAIGIAISFVGLIFRVNLPIIIIIITYIISVLIPLTIIIFEKKGLFLSEIINLNIAKYYYKKNDKEKAKQLLMKSTEKFPNSLLLHKELAFICEELGDKQIAIDEYMRSSEINSQDSELKIKTANLLKDSEKIQDAERMLNDILRKKPDDYNATILLGDILTERENYRDAINLYLQALNYNPDQYELYYNLGMLFTLINDFQTAKEYYEKAAKLNSLLYSAKYNLGQLDEAEEYFTECIEDEDIADEVFYYLSYVSMLKGNINEAVQYLNTAVEENEELYEKACKETVFRLIIHKINKPTNTSKVRKNISKKEKQTMKHLEKTCEVVGNLNHNDIKAIKHLREREKQEEMQRKIEQQNIQQKEQEK